MQTQDPPKVDGPLDAIISAMAEAHDLDIARYEEAFLRSTISTRMEACGIATADAYAGHLKTCTSEAGMFFQALRIDHSEFFRNPLTFAVLEQLVLPVILDQKRKSAGGEIRVWSAGCANGQEAWSLAMLLEEICGETPYQVFATDLTDPDVARAGIFSTAAVGNVRMHYLSKYFSRQGDSFSIVSCLRKHVDFSVHDLLDRHSASPAASIYGGFDLILCCNVLLYYPPEARQRVGNKIHAALSPGGYFVTGEAERGIFSGHNGFLAVQPPSAVFRMTNVPK